MLRKLESKLEETAAAADRYLFTATFVGGSGWSPLLTANNKWSTPRTHHPRPFLILP